MKRVLSAVLCIVMTLCVASVVYANGQSFTDVTPDKWYYNDVMRAVELGIINGKTTTTYAPDDNLTYAETIKLAACMYQLHKEGVVLLTSGGDPWYQTYVNYCTSVGIILTDEYPFNEKITRTEYMAIFAKALPDDALAPINYISFDSIPDVPETEEFAHIYKLYRAGILAGSDADHNCKPFDTIKRSEVAAIITRMMNEDARIKFNIGEPAEELEIPENAEAAPEVDENETADEKVETAEMYDKLVIAEQPRRITGASEDEMLQYTVRVEGGKAPYTYSWKTRSRYDNGVEIEESDYIVGVKKATLSVLFNVNNMISDSTFYCEVTDSLGQTVRTDSLTLPEPALIMSGFDVVEVNEIGRVFTGRVMTGVLRKGDFLLVCIPEKNIFGGGVVERLEMFKKELDEATVGNHVGIVFKDFRDDINPDCLNNAYSKSFVETVRGKGTFGVKLPVQASIINVTDADAGQRAYMEVDAVGGKAPYTYVWQVREAVLESEFRDISEFWGSAEGYDTAKLSFITANITYEADQRFRCVVTDADGSVCITPEVYVTPKSKTYVIFPKTSLYANPQDEVELEVELRAPSDVEPEYHWMVKTDNHKEYVTIDPVDTWASGANTSKLTILVEKADFEAHAKYMCFISCPGKYEFYTAIYNVYPKNIVITGHPENTVGQHGDKVQFKVVAEGGTAPYTYQWLIKLPENEIPLKITDAYPWSEGHFTDTLTVAVDEGKLDSDITFSCIVTDANGVSRTSREAYVIVSSDANVTLDENPSKPDMIVIID